MPILAFITTIFHLSDITDQTPSLVPSNQSINHLRSILYKAKTPANTAPKTPINPAVWTAPALGVEVVAGAEVVSAATVEEERTVVLETAVVLTAVTEAEEVTETEEVVDAATLEDVDATLDVVDGEPVGD